MRNLLPLAFYFWLYNQLFFFIGALGFFLIRLFVAIAGFGGMDALAGGVGTALYAFILYKLFGRYLWRRRLQQYKPAAHVLLCSSLLPFILGSVVLTACLAIAEGKLYNTMTGMPVLAAINLSLSYLPLAKSVWIMLVIGAVFNIFTITCFWRYCQKYLSMEIPWFKLLTAIAICLVACTIVIYAVTVTALPDPVVGS